MDNNYFAIKYVDSVILYILSDYKIIIMRLQNCFKNYLFRFHFIQYFRIYLMTHYRISSPEKHARPKFMIYAN